jgi:Tfp pilus assembly protein PilO
VNGLRNLPRPVLLALPALGGIVVIALGWFLLVSPQGQRAASLRTQAASVRQQVSDELAQAAAAKTAAGAPTIRVADVYKLDKAMPSIEGMPDLLLQLNQLAEASGVDLASISPAAPTAGTTYSTLPVTLSVTGDFYSVTDLLYRLRNQVSVRNGALVATGRIFSVGSVSMTPVGKKVTANITLDTYIYAPVPATTTPSGTSTTQTDTTTTTSSGPSAAGTP